MSLSILLRCCYSQESESDFLEHSCFQVTAMPRPCISSCQVMAEQLIAISWCLYQFMQYSGKSRHATAVDLWLQAVRPCTQTNTHSMTTKRVCCIQDAIETFLHYLYYDKVDSRTSPQHVVAVLHVAHYYGAGRLVGLCEAILAKELKRGDRDDEGLCCFCVCTSFICMQCCF